MKKVEDMTREELIETIRHHEDLILRMCIIKGEYGSNESMRQLISSKNHGENDFEELSNNIDKCIDLVTETLKLLEKLKK